MLVYKGTLLNKTSKGNLVFGDEHKLIDPFCPSKNSIQACPDPYQCFLYGVWDELWLAEMNVISQSGCVLHGDHIKFLKQLEFAEGLNMTKNMPMFAYYWAVNFHDILSEEELERLIPYITKDEECVISWAENMGTYLNILKTAIYTPRYSYLWKLEGFPTTPHIEAMSDEYTRVTKQSWRKRRL